MILGHKSLRAFSLNLASYNYPLVNVEVSLWLLEVQTHFHILPLLFIESLSSNDGKGNETKKGIEV